MSNATKLTMAQLATLCRQWGSNATKLTLAQLATLCRQWGSSHGSYIDDSIESVVLSEELSECLDNSDHAKMESLGVDLVAYHNNVENNVSQETLTLYRFLGYDIRVYENNAWTDIDMAPGHQSLADHCLSWFDNQCESTPDIVLQQIGFEKITVTFDEKTIWFACEGPDREFCQDWWPYECTSNDAEEFTKGRFGDDEAEVDRCGGAVAKCLKCGAVEQVAMFVDGKQTEPWKNADAYEDENGPNAGPLPPRPVPDKLTVRVGHLAVAMAKRLAETGDTPNEYIRQLIEKDLESHSD